MEYSIITTNRNNNNNMIMIIDIRIKIRVNHQHQRRDDNNVDDYGNEYLCIRGKIDRIESMQTMRVNSAPRKSRMILLDTLFMFNLLRGREHTYRRASFFSKPGTKLPL
mmetsp:Transcript_10992/g.12112  ORF Transcript_10992/g.12112 Transcript_10992/m.12112 type:complete len:109 (-) Transcript_10992:39-365(-)